MTETSSIARQVDSYIDEVFAGWSIYTTILAVLLVGYLISPLLFSVEPDVHPMLLSRQASATPVRQPGESAIHRNLAVPDGFPLRSGLNVKEPGAARWTAGKDGDLRDIWRQAITNIITGVNGGKNVISVHGKGDIFKHNLEDLSKEINIIGKHVLKIKVTRVAICLPNSAELLVSILAAVFYGFTPILIQPGQPLDPLLAMLKETKADALIVAAGTVPLEAVSEAVPTIKSFISVVSEASRQIDFVTDDASSQWHEIIENGMSQAMADLPASNNDDGPNIIIAQSINNTRTDVTEYTQKNIIAAVAAQLSALPRGHAFEPSDLVLSLESLANTYPLAICLAALYSGASVAMTSVASSTADYDLAFQQGLSPTIVVASSYTMRKAYENRKSNLQGVVAKFYYSRQLRSLSAGAFGFRASLASARLVYVCENGLPGVPVTLDSQKRAELTALVHSRIIYALVVPRVAGAVAQTNPLDYRSEALDETSAHFGPPVTAVEVKLVDTSSSGLAGKIVAMGPAVVGGVVNTGISGMFRSDNTLSLSGDVS